MKKRRRLPLSAFGSLYSFLYPVTMQSRNAMQVRIAKRLCHFMKPDPFPVVLC